MNDSCLISSHFSSTADRASFPCKQNANYGFPSYCADQDAPMRDFLKSLPKMQLGSHANLLWEDIKNTSSPFWDATGSGEHQGLGGVWRGSDGAHLTGGSNVCIIPHGTKKCQDPAATDGALNHEVVDGVVRVSDVGRSAFGTVATGAWGEEPPSGITEPSNYNQPWDSITSITNLDTRTTYKENYLAAQNAAAR